MKLPRYANIWLPGYLKARWRDGWRRNKPSRVWVMIADHYEPYWHHPTDAVATDRVQHWATKWPVIASRNLDSAGKPAQYSFFYPQEEYRPHLLESIAEMCRSGFGDVEIHIHHDGEGRQNFIDRMTGFMETLHSRHGLLRRSEGRLVFGFIHGNWALDNSRPDGRWCGLNDEITIQRDIGCYADFTMPSGAGPTQSRMVNTIYWTTDDPARPKSYDTGVPATRNGNHHGDLLMIPGPLGIRWGERLAPRLEIAEFAHNDLATPYRVRRCIELAPRIGDDVFLKLHTHGAQEKNATALLDGGLDRLFQLLRLECERSGHTLHYATAWQLYQAVLKSLGVSARAPQPS